MIGDPISDMLNRIITSQAVLKPAVKVPFSKMKFEIAKIMENEGFIEKVEKRGRFKKVLIITLKYDEEKRPAISGLKRISKPGQRIYQGYRELKKVKGGYGISILSTSQGLMTDREAKKKKIGGEVLCEIW